MLCVNSGGKFILIKLNNQMDIIIKYIVLYIYKKIL